MLPKIDALPGAQSEPAGVDGDREIHGGQSAAHVGGHIIVAFDRVHKKRVAVRHEPGEESVEVAADIGVGIFLDEERGRSVANVKRQQTAFKAMLSNPSLNLRRELV